MIRRTVQAASGAPSWVLISQVEHAHLAGRLAEAWGAAPFAPLEPRDELLAAVYRHDDGWMEWEARPAVDPQPGRPLDFTEMPLADSLLIWRRSIDSAARLGSLVAYLVSGHFSYLLRRSRSRADSPDEDALARQFLEEQDRLRLQWLAAWRAADPAQRTVALAERALALLQWFDFFSLWLCCAERSQSQEVQPPGGPPLSLAPRTLSEIALSPWPLLVDQLEVAVSGRLLPALHYSSASELAAATSQDVMLRWLLVR